MNNKPSVLWIAWYIVISPFVIVWLIMVAIYTVVFWKTIKCENDIEA